MTADPATILRDAHAALLRVIAESAGRGTSREAFAIVIAQGALYNAAREHLPAVLAEHAAMRERLEELEELCVGDGGPPRWRGSGSPVSEGWT